MALVLFQMVLVGTHLPSVVALYASNSIVHFSLHALWVVAAVVFWFPVLGGGGAVRCALATTDEDRVSGRCDRGAHGARLVLAADRDGVLSVLRDGAAGVGISPVLDFRLLGS